MPHESKRVVPNMKNFRKILCLSLCLLAACLLALPCAQADGAWGQYASLKMKIATRTGPSTDYTEPGTFFPDTWRNQQVRVLTRCQTNGTWWLQIEFENKGSRYRAYTGLKRVNVDISTVPDEYPMGTAYIAGDMYPIGFYGPGTGTFLLLLLTGAARMPLSDSAGITKVINLSSNIAALAVYIFSGNVLYPLGLAAGVFSIAGNYLGTRVFTAKGSRGVKPIMITVLGIFFIKLCYELFFAK